ncbi:MAG: acyl-CoA thioesterase, partial [Ktedonobacterales bacterium]
MNERRAQRVRFRNGEAGDIERCRQWVDVEVRYSDLDAQGRVNNAIFFTYFEQARVAFLAEVRARGLEHLRREEGVANSSLVST